MDQAEGCLLDPKMLERQHHTQRGFFLWVAAALDMLFKGPGGWRIEPNWWQRNPADFGDQLNWCELCGAALDTKRRDANEQVDDVSPILIDRLREVNSPKLKQGRMRVYPSDSFGETASIPALQSNQYIDDFSNRLGTSNLNLLPKSITAIIRSDSSGRVDQLEAAIREALHIFDEVALIIETSPTDFTSLPVDLTEHERIRFVELKDKSWGHCLQSIMQTSSNPDWFLVLSSGMMLPDELAANLKQTFINPGVLYTFSLPKTNTASLNSASTLNSNTDFSLFNHMAQAIRQAGGEGVARCADWQQYKSLWPDDKRVDLSVLPDNLPETDERGWMQVVDREFLEDGEFGHQFAAVMAERVSPKDNILVAQSASYFLTHALIQVLIRLDYTVHLLTHERFTSHFRDILPSDRIIEFSSCDQIRFDALEELCEVAKDKLSFAGAVVPFSSPRQMIEPEDGYHNIEKVAIAMAGRILCGVNLKRQIVEGHANHQTIHENRWGY